MKRRLYYWLHFTHAVLLFFLLLSGMILYVPSFRSLFIEIRWEIRWVHTMVGFLYFVFVLAIIPYLIRYLRKDRRWTKTFHVSLMVSFAVCWTVTGAYLYVNETSYLGIRQAAIEIHDVLSFFIIPWIGGHLYLWYARKKGKPKKPVLNRDQGIFISRRDVLLLFSGGLLAFFFGGFWRWIQPLSADFLAALNEVKNRGYFRIYSVRSENPEFDSTSWKLSVVGEVEKELQFSFDELLKLSKIEFSHDFHCVTGWSVTDVKWEGIAFSEIARLAGTKAKYVKMYSADQFYTETYELSQLMQKNVVLAYRLDGKPLAASQGAPLRLFHPDMYGYKSIKWLNRIEFTDRRDLGYWEEKEGYNLNGYIS